MDLDGQSAIVLSGQRSGCPRVSGCVEQDQSNLTGPSLSFAMMSASREGRASLQMSQCGVTAEKCAPDLGSSPAFLVKGKRQRSLLLRSNYLSWGGPSSAQHTFSTSFSVGKYFIDFWKKQKGSSGGSALGVGLEPVGGLCAQWPPSSTHREICQLETLIPCPS